MSASRTIQSAVQRGAHSAAAGVASAWRPVSPSLPFVCVSFQCKEIAAKKTAPRINAATPLSLRKNVTDIPRASARCTRTKSAGSCPGRGSALRPSCPPCSLRAVVELDPSSRRRPLSFTGAGVSWQIIDPAATNAGPCNAIFGSCDAEDRPRRRLLLLPTLRLLRCLLRRCFRLSLLRHCCPPSLSGWRHRYSAVANRLALASAYTSTEKKTAFSPNFVYRFRFALSCRLRVAPRIYTCARKSFAPAQTSSKNSR